MIRPFIQIRTTSTQAGSLTRTAAFGMTRLGYLRLGTENEFVPGDISWIRLCLSSSRPFCRSSISRGSSELMERPKNIHLQEQVSRTCLGSLRQEAQLIAHSVDLFLQWPKSVLVLNCPKGQKGRGPDPRRYNGALKRTNGRFHIIYYWSNPSSEDPWVL